MNLSIRIIFTLSLVSSTTLAQAFNPYKATPDQLEKKIGRVTQKLKGALSPQEKEARQIQLKILENLKTGTPAEKVAPEYLKLKTLNPLFNDPAYKDITLSATRTQKGAKFIHDLYGRLSRKANKPFSDELYPILEPMSYNAQKPTDTEFSKALVNCLDIALNGELKSNLLNRELFDIRDRVKQEAPKMGIGKKLAKSWFSQVFSGILNLSQDYDTLLANVLGKLKTSKDLYETNDIKGASKAYYEAINELPKLQGFQNQLVSSFESVRLNSLLKIPGVTYKDTMDFGARISKSPDIHATTGLFEKDETKKPINTETLKGQKYDISNFSVRISLTPDFEVPLDTDKILRFFFPVPGLSGIYDDRRVNKYSPDQLKSLPDKMKGFEVAFKEFTQFYQLVEAEGVFYRDINTVLDDRVKKQDKSVTEDPQFKENRTNNNQIVTMFFDMGERLGNSFLQTVFAPSVQLDQALRGIIQKETRTLREMKKKLRLVENV